MAVDLFLNTGLQCFYFLINMPFFFISKTSAKRFLIVDVSFPIVPFFLADDYFLQSNINNSHFWSQITQAFFLFF